MDIDTDRKISATEPIMKCLLSHIAETYKDSLDAAIKKVTNYTVEEKYEYLEI